jgi:RNA polymerase sigma factor (TIGR02999 family)
MIEQTQVTELLARARLGEREAFDRVLQIVYAELQRIARRQLRGRPSDTLDTNALVHEAYLKLAGSEPRSFADRAHFLAVAGVAMRQVLIDHARQHLARKRGGAWRRVTLDDSQFALVDDQAEHLLALDDALTRLATLSPRLAQVVECRFFGGLSEEETASALGVTSRTVRRDWTKARALLRDSLGSAT